jgi:hypothetical protein
MIEEITYRLRVFRHKLHEKLAEWLENDWFFFAFIAAIAAAVIFSSQIKAFFQNVKLFQTLKTIVEKIKEGKIAIHRLNLIIDLKLMHQISKVFFEEYREVMAAFSEAVSQLCAELGEGSGYLHAYFAAARGVKMGAGAVLGLDMEVVEASWYNDTTDFLRRANEDFRRYAREPGLLYYDFMNWQLRNAYDDFREVRQAEVDEVRKAHERVTEIDHGLTAIQVNVDRFIQNLPGEIREQFEARWGPAREYILELIEMFNSTIVPMFAELDNAFSEHRDMQIRINETAMREMRKTTDLMLQPWAADESIRNEYSGSMEYLLSQRIGDDQDPFDSLSRDYMNRLSGITSDYITGLSAISALGFEEPTARHVSRPIEPLSIPSPFVGDY